MRLTSVVLTSGISSITNNISWIVGWPRSDHVCVCECASVIDLIHKSQNAPVPYPTILHSEQKCAHFCSEWSIVGYGTGAFWDLWNGSIDSTNWYKGRKNKYWYFFVWKFGFWPGEVMEKSWNFFLRFLWEPCLKSMIFNKDFLTWLLSGWQLCFQPIKCLVWKSTSYRQAYAYWMALCQLGLYFLMIFFLWLTHWPLEYITLSLTCRALARHFENGVLNAYGMHCKHDY